MIKKTNRFSLQTAMIKRVITIWLLAMVFGLFSTINPVQAKVAETNDRINTVENTQRRSRRFGPFATLRRANQVVRYARKRGYKAKVIYAGCLYCGTRKYYVDVWR